MSQSNQASLVLLPGLGFSSQVFQPLQSLCANQFNCLPTDLPDVAEQWIDALLPSLPARAHYLGWSLGGLVACYLAINHPERVQSIAMLATSPCFLKQADWPGVELGHWDFFSKNEAPLLVVQKRLLALQGDAACRRGLKPHQLSGDYPGWSMGLRALATWDFREALTQLTIPWCALYGGGDQLLSSQLPVAMKAFYPKKTIKIVEQAPHALLHTHPQDCFHVLKEFWRELD